MSSIKAEALRLREHIKLQDASIAKLKAAHAQGDAMDAESLESAEKTRADMTDRYNELVRQYTVLNARPPDWRDLDRDLPTERPKMIERIVLLLRQRNGVMGTRIAECVAGHGWYSRCVISNNEMMSQSCIS